MQIHIRQRHLCTGSWGCQGLRYQTSGSWKKWWPQHILQSVHTRRWRWCGEVFRGPSQQPWSGNRHGWAWDHQWTRWRGEWAELDVLQWEVLMKPNCKSTHFDLIRNFLFCFVLPPITTNHVPIAPCHLLLQNSSLFISHSFEEQNVGVFFSKCILDLRHWRRIQGHLWYTINFY